MKNSNTTGRGWKEKSQPIMTRKGIEDKAPRHYEVSVKKDLEDVLRQPLVLVDNTTPIIRDVPLTAKNAVEQFQERRLLYSGDYTIIRETMQNSERIARDRHVPVDIVMTFTDDSFKIEDNGGGTTSKEADVVFALGKSGYKNLNQDDTNPFGEGMISFLLLFSSADIISNNCSLDFNWGSIEEQYKKNPTSFDFSRAYKMAEYDNDEVLKAKGKFIAIFKKPLPKYNKEKAIKIAKELAKTLQVRSIIINGELMNNKIDFAAVPRGYVGIKKEYQKAEGGIGLEGWFMAGTEYSYLKLYDHSVPVGSISNSVVDNRYQNLEAMEGVCNIKTTFYGQANKSRDGWIKDDRIERTENIIKELARDYAISLVDNLSDSQIEKVQHFISTYTTWNDIRYHIKFDIIEPEITELVTKVERDLHKELSEEGFKQHMSEILNSPSKLTEAVERAKDYSPKMDVAAYNEKQKQLEQEHQKLQQEKVENKPDATEQQAVQEKQGVIDEKQQDLKDDKEKMETKRKTVEEKVTEYLEARSGGGMTFGKYKKLTFWCTQEEQEKYIDTIRMAGYYRINIAISKNKFQKQGFESFDNFTHISQLESSMRIVPKISRPGAQNTKEKRLEFVMRCFLDASGFNNIKVVISDIVARRVIRIQKSEKTTDETVELVAYAEPSTNSIYLQRKISFGTADGLEDYSGVRTLYPLLEYNDYSLEDKSIGSGDIAVFHKIKSTLAHELAHLVYNTKDDTVEHYKSMVVILGKFDSVIAEFKASSRISESLEGLNKKARDRIGVQKGDQVVVTVTKGTEGQVEKQEVPALRKTSMNDIYQQVLNGELFTYRQLIEKYDDIEDLQKAINTGTYTFTGYKIGDTVLFKNKYGDEKTGQLKKTGDFGANTIGIDEGTGNIYYYPLENIIKTIDKIKPKYLKGEIFVDEAGRAKTYTQILEYFDAGDFPIESGQYKSTGLKVGDIVTYPEYQSAGSSAVAKTTWGKIKAVSISLTLLEQYEDGKFSKYETYRDVDEVKKKVEPTNQLSFSDLLKGG